MSELFYYRPAHELPAPDKANSSRQKPKDVGEDAEAFYASQFDSGGVFEARDSKGKEHWCYSFDNNAEEGYLSLHFVLHSACLTILEHALATNQTPSQGRSLDDFYELLCAGMTQDGVDQRGSSNFPWKHEYYGAAQFEEQDWVAMKRWEVCTLLQVISFTPDRDKRLIRGSSFFVLIPLTFLE